MKAERCLNCKMPRKDIGKEKQERKSSAHEDHGGLAEVVN